MFAALSAFAGVAYWYYQDTQSAIRQYEINQVQLETALKSQRLVTTQLQENIRVMQEIIGDLNEEFSVSRERVATLESKFNQSANGTSRDFGALAASKPDSIQRIINNGTLESFRCIELLSGAAIKPEELDNENLVNCTTTR